MGHALPSAWGASLRTPFTNMKHSQRLPTGDACFQDRNIMLSRSVLWLLLHSYCHFRSSFAQSLYLSSLLLFSPHLSPFPSPYPLPPPPSQDNRQRFVPVWKLNAAIYVFFSIPVMLLGNYITQPKEKNITGTQPCLEGFYMSTQNKPCKQNAAKAPS